MNSAFLLSLANATTTQLVSYGLIYIACACLVYWVLVKRTEVEEDLPRQFADTIFAVILGLGALIAVLSQFRPENIS